MVHISHLRCYHVQSLHLLPSLENSPSPKDLVSLTSTRPFSLPQLKPLFPLTLIPNPQILVPIVKCINPPHPKHPNTTYPHQCTSPVHVSNSHSIAHPQRLSLPNPNTQDFHCQIPNITPPNQLPLSDVKYTYTDLNMQINLNGIFKSNSGN